LIVKAYVEQLIWQSEIVHEDTPVPGFCIS